MFKLYSFKILSYLKSCKFCDLQCLFATLKFGKVKLLNDL